MIKSAVQNHDAELFCAYGFHDVSQISSSRRRKNDCLPFNDNHPLEADFVRFKATQNFRRTPDDCDDCNKSVKSTRKPLADAERARSIEFCARVASTNHLTPPYLPCFHPLHRPA